MANPITSFGSVLKRGDGGTPEVFAAIARVKSITPPQLSTDTEDVTTHDSPGSFEEVLPTILRTGEASLTLNYDPDDTGHTGLRTDWLNKTKRNFKIEYADPTPTVVSFSAYVTGYAVGELTPEGVMELEVTMKPTGEVTEA